MAAPTPPSAPVIGLQEVFEQFWTDLSGKEVQSAATYSYLWIADQGGHIGLGILVRYLVFLLLETLTGNTGLANPGATLITLAAAAWWEWRAYKTTAAEASGGSFAPDLKLLARNALIAWAYMAIGALMGHCFSLPWSIALFAIPALIALAVLLAPAWIRQKIIWQKAGLPYLSRLASPLLKTTPDATAGIQSFLLQPPPPDGAPRQLVVVGALGSGRTCLATALGTETAFRDWKVRYLTFDKLCAFARPPGQDDAGPRNINYWPWREAQFLVIDDVASALRPGLQADQAPPRATALRRALAALGPFGGELTNRHTLWVLDPLDDLDDWVETIRDLCQGQQPPLVVKLT